MTIDLIYLPGCPNIGRARANLLTALAATSREATWREWDGADQTIPAYLLGYGSPTILVDGQDVADEASAPSGSSCRLYQNEAVYEGAPSIEQIGAALHRSQGARPRSAERSPKWTASLAALPGIAFSAMPKLACPACWPAYSGLLGSMGLSVLVDDSPYLLLLTAAFLMVAVGALAWGAASRRGYGPFAAGIAASSLILVGKFAYASDVAMYTGLTALIGASIWNAWPVKGATACSTCHGPSLSRV